LKEHSAAIQHHKANNPLHSSHGFCSRRFVDTYFLEFYDFITKLLDTEVFADMILLVFSKAFNKVYHKRLALKLYTVKFEEKSMLWILDYLHQQSQFVQLFDG